MAITLEQAQVTKKDLEPKYQERHETHKRLRDLWSGRNLWQAPKNSNDIASVFRDLVGTSGTVGPDLKMHIPIIQEVCLKYQSFLSPLPMIRVYTDPPETENRKRQATKKSRYLYGTWNQRPLSMKDILNKAAWYLPLMGDCFLGAYPDIKNTIIRPVMRSPEYAYPIQSYDSSTLDAVIFSWSVPETTIARKFPNYVRQADENRGRFSFRGWRKRESEPMVEIIEYSDTNEFARWAGGQKLNGVQHDYGFNLFDQLQFIHVPDEAWGHGAVEQSATMAEGGDVLYSLLLHAVLENVFPRLILEDPSKFGEELETGPGSVIGVNPGGKAYFLNPPAQAFQTAFLDQNERMIKQATGMPEASFGQFQGGSTHISGRAINEMQGAGTGSTVEMVQGLGIGSGMVSFNEKSILMGRQMFKDDTINLSGFETGSAIDIVPRYFTASMKGSELVGSCRNEVVFSPHLNLPEKLVMGLQGLGADLWSKQYVREQTGVADSAAMDEEILGEKIMGIALSALEQAMMAAPEDVAGTEQKGFALLAGGQPGAPAGPPVPPSLPPNLPPPGPIGGGAPPGGGGPPVAPLGGGGSVMAPALKEPPGAPISMPPGTSDTQPPPQNPNSIKLDEAIKAFQSVSGLQGRVFLVGEIVQNSETRDDIEAALTDSKDKQTLNDQLPQYAGRLTFHVVSKEPIEPHIEVTPGAAPEQKGAHPDLASILQGAQ